MHSSIHSQERQDALWHLRRYKPLLGSLLNGEGLFKPVDSTHSRRSKRRLRSCSQSSGNDLVTSNDVACRKKTAIEADMAFIRIDRRIFHCRLGYTRLLRGPPVVVQDKAFATDSLQYSRTHVSRDSLHNMH